MALLELERRRVIALEDVAQHRADSERLAQLTEAVLRTLRR